MKDFSMRGFFISLRKRALLLAIVPLLAAMLTLLLCFILPNQYMATASLYVAVRYQDATGTQRLDMEAASLLATDYKALFARSPVLQNAGVALGLSDITKSIHFEVDILKNTRIVEIRALGRDAALCAEAANVAAQQFTNYLSAFLRADHVIIQDAIVPQSPAQPRTALYTAGAYGITLLFCLFLVLVVDQLSNRVRSEMQISQQLGLSLLASVPDYRKLLRRFVGNGGERSARLYRYVPDNVREGAKTAAVNIAEAGLDATVRTMAITSVTKGEGKSSLAVLLASAYAEDGKRVLLVDMDMRNPTLGALLKRQGPYDLTDYLAGRMPLSEVAVRTSYKNLFLIDSHHRAALVSRMIASKRFTEFLEEALAQFDYVLFDTSPLGLFIDPALLAAKLDGAVLAIADNRIEVSQVQKTLDQLSRSKVSVLGVILNYVKASEKYTAYGKVGRRTGRVMSAEEE